jgi:3-deoxy-D-manno-octulosonic-acid transferase
MGMLMYLLYSALLALVMIVTLPYWLLQMLRHGKYRAGLRQRLGAVPAALSPIPPARTIWVHAVSVGEVVASAAVIEGLRHEFPSRRVLVSTTTATGQKLAQKRFGKENVFYFPLDFAFAIRPYLDALHPELCVIAETEFWPNFLRLARQSGARIAVINCRISDRSFPRYQRLRPLLAKVLDNVDLFLPQTEEDCKRLVAIGAVEAKATVAGNLKFDVAPPAAPAIIATLRDAFAEKEGEPPPAWPILVCGSTLDGEEGALLSAFRNILLMHPRAVMILAPRHPERFDEVANLIEQLGFPMWRRSLWGGELLSGGVFLLDTIGELAAMYSLATVAFVGGSLVPRGGHNILEPSLYGVPVVTGNHYENFRDIVEFFLSRNAVRVVGLAELPLVLIELIEHAEERATLGRNALSALESQRGATARTIRALSDLIGQSAPVGQSVSEAAR